MARLWCVRIAAAIAVVALALLVVSLAPFLGTAPTAGARLSGALPTVSVNRSLKGDRLPLFNSGISESTAAKPTVSPDAVQAPNRAQPRQQMPVGCDPAFSTVAYPSLANFFGRCMA